MQAQDEQKQPFSVYVRVRPINVRSAHLVHREKDKLPMHIRGQKQQILQILDLPNSVQSYQSIQSDQDSFSYLFDKVFNDDQNNLDVFSTAIQPLIPQLLEGYNVTCFAYGMTSSGKTHTMFGELNDRCQTQEATDLESLQHAGLCNLAIQNLFYQMLQKQNEFSYNVNVSYVELYNEKVIDLLCDLKQSDRAKGGSIKNKVRNILDSMQGEGQQQSFNTSKSSPNNSFQNNQKNLKIVEDPAKGVSVQNLSEIAVQEASELMDLINLGNKRRVVANTGAHQFSSRSHAILIFNIEGYSEVDEHGNQTIVRSKLQMIDLAGSERASTTQNTGQRMVEGSLINKSLLALGKCINILADQNTQTNPQAPQPQARTRQNSKHYRSVSPFPQPPQGQPATKKRFIPYRDSKLTRLLKDSLGGSTKTVMIACINQLKVTFDETLNTLKYASKAKNIMNPKLQNQIIFNEYKREQEIQQAKYLHELQQQQQQKQVREKAQIQTLQKEILHLKNERESIKEVPMNLSCLEQSSEMEEGGMTKLQKRKSLKKKASRATLVGSIEAVISNQLVPSILMQFNIRQQIQSHTLMQEYTQQETVEANEEVGKLIEELEASKATQMAIQSSIFSQFEEQQLYIEKLEKELQKTSQPQCDHGHLTEQLLQLQAQNEQLHEENKDLLEEKEEMKELMKQMRDLNSNQAKQQKVKEQTISNQTQNLKYYKNQNLLLKQKNEGISKELADLQNEVGQLRHHLSLQNQPLDTDQQMLEMMNPLEIGSLKSSEVLSDDLEISKNQINETLNRPQPPLPETKPKQRILHQKTSKSSKQDTKNSKQLKRYLSVTNQEGLLNKQKQNRFIIKKEKESNEKPAANKLYFSKSQAQLGAQEDQKENHNSSNQKFKMIESHIFGRTDPLESMAPLGLKNLNRMQTLQAQPQQNTLKPTLSYPKLRESANNSKFQRNLRPWSHSRIDRRFSYVETKSMKNRLNVSQPRYTDYHLSRCMTNLELHHEPLDSNLMSLNRNLNNSIINNFQQSRQGHLDRQLSFTFEQQMMKNQLFEGDEDVFPMNVSNLSMEFTKDDPYRGTEAVQYFQQRGQNFSKQPSRENLQPLGYFRGHNTIYTPAAKNIVCNTGNSSMNKLNIMENSSSHQLTSEKNRHTRNSNGHKVKELVSYAEVRQQSKDKRKKANAVLNLAANFENFKNTQISNDETLKDQMLIVDSIEQQIQKSQGEIKQTHRENMNLITQYIAGDNSSILKTGSPEFENPQLKEFVEANNQKMAEIQEMAERIERRSLERCMQIQPDEKASCPNLLLLNQRQRAHSSQSSNSNFNAFMNQELRSGKKINTTLNSEVKSENKKFGINSSKKASNQKRGAPKNAKKRDERNCGRGTPGVVSISPPRRVPNFQQKLNSSVQGLFSMQEARIDMQPYKEESQLTGQPRQEPNTQRTQQSRRSESSQIFMKFEKTMKEVRDSLNVSPNNFTARRQAHQVPYISEGQMKKNIQSFTHVQTSPKPFDSANNLTSNQLTSPQNFRMPQFFRVEDSSQNTNQTRQVRPQQQVSSAQNYELTQAYQEEVQSIEKFMHLQKQISASYIERAYGNASNQSQSRTPERPKKNVNNFHELTQKKDSLLQTQEKHHFQHLIESGQKKDQLIEQTISPKPKQRPKFELNLENLNKEHTQSSFAVGHNSSSNLMSEKYLQKMNL